MEILKSFGRVGHGEISKGPLGFQIGQQDFTLESRICPGHTTPGAECMQNFASVRMVSYFHARDISLTKSMGWGLVNLVTVGTGTPTPSFNQPMIEVDMAVLRMT